MEALLPDGVFKHLLQEAKGKDSLRQAVNLCEEDRKAGAKDSTAGLPAGRMEIDEFGSLDDVDDPITEEQIQAHIDHLLQPQTRGDPDKVAELRVQMARDLSSLVPKKKLRNGVARSEGAEQKSPL